MLKVRIITAVMIAAIVLPLLFAAPAPLFAVIAGIVVLAVGGWEAAQLGGLTRPAARWSFAGLLLAVGLTMGASLGLYPWGGSLLPDVSSSWPELLIVPVLLWPILMAWLLRPGLGGGPSPAWRAVKLLALAIILLAAWLALSWLQRASAWLVVMLILIIAAADIGAYFTGRHVGGPKLAPRISPGKTWSGVAGGMVATMIISALAGQLLPDSPFSWYEGAVIGLVLASISVGGDLFESLLKRQQGIKDSSQLLPGHGGILDRIDSLGAALPFFALAVAVLSGPH
jgi:phosphatidate cytidylyltransferase